MEEILTQICGHAYNLGSIDNSQDRGPFVWGDLALLRAQNVGNIGLAYWTIIFGHHTDFLAGSCFSEGF